ncbi:hypothetical protein KFF05_17190 [bacterium SCSIO 12827]|nr:hypothetical protein KFF05_17190 [bacterium SCSIO 12827]
MAALDDKTPAAAIERNIGLLTILIIAGWAVFMLIVKFRLAHHGLATDDLYNYANALYNTNFWDKWLYNARYAVGRDLPSLAFDHWQPTTLVLWPVVRLFGPHSLLVIQALAPIWACLFLIKIGCHLGLNAFDRLFTVIICLFSPYMMLAVMDSIEGFHATSLLLLFGAPLAWAAVMGRWTLALVLLLFFLNVRENAALYVLGAVIGHWILGNGYFDGRRRALAALLIAALVFWIGIKGAPMLAGVDNFHFSKVGHAVGTSEILKFNIAAIDKDWAAYLLGLWPAIFAPGALITVIPEAIVLLIADKKIVNWYGMSLVFAGALAATFGIAWIRRTLPAGIWGRTLTAVFAVHMAALAMTSPVNVWEKTGTIIERYGYVVPEASLAAARAKIDPQCGTSVFFQAMKGFGDLPQLLYPHPTQAAQARYIIVSKREPLGLNHNRLQVEFVADVKNSLILLHEDPFLRVYERTDAPCVPGFSPKAG